MTKKSPRGPKSPIGDLIGIAVLSSERGWMQKSAEGQPKLKITVSPCSRMYDRFNMDVPRVAAAQIEGLADTGAQSCLWGIKDFYKCGFKRSQLIPVRHRLPNRMGTISL